MEIRVAKTAGFCFGVNRAVELTYGLLAEGHRVATLGPLIHNPQAVEDMQRKGAQVVDTVQDVPAGYEVVIRRSSASPPRPKKPGQCCWWRAIRPTRRCRGSWVTPAERCSFLPIWPN